MALDGHDLVGPAGAGPAAPAAGHGPAGRPGVHDAADRGGAAGRLPRGGRKRSLLAGPLRVAARATETVTFGDGPRPPPRPGIGAAVRPADVRPRRRRPDHRRAPTSPRPSCSARARLRDGTVQLVHTINGAASPEVPPLVVREGQLVRLRLVNDTGEFHPMHLHGHVMTVLDVDGRRADGQPAAPRHRHPRAARDGRRRVPGRQPGALDAALPRPAARPDGDEHDDQLRGHHDAVHDGRGVGERAGMSRLEDVTPMPRRDGLAVAASLSRSSASARSSSPAAGAARSRWASRSGSRRVPSPRGGPDRCRPRG